MAYRKLANLACKLYQKTIQGDVNWEETAWTGTYQASFADYSILISLQPSHKGGEDDVKISIRDGEGNEIESFLDVDLEDSWLLEFGVVETSYSLLKDTYDTARRAALGSEKAINEILSVLEDDGIPF